MTPAQACERLRLHIVTKYRRQTVAAKAWGVSDQYVSAVLLGRKDIPPVMLDEIGLVRVVTVEYRDRESPGPAKGRRRLSVDPDPAPNG